MSSQEPLHDPEAPSVEQPSSPKPHLEPVMEAGDETPRKKVNILTALPHVSLLALLVIYLLLGGAVFQGLELPTETKLRTAAVRLLEKHETKLANRLWNVTQQDMRKENFLKTVKAEVKAVEDQAVKVAKLSYDKVNQRGGEVIWTYSRSVYFAWTMITTIGNSRMVDLTYSGRVLAVIYALVGIPLLLITVADVGKMFADGMACCFAKLKNRLKKQRHSGYDEAKRADEADEDVEIASAPWCVVLVLLALYILLGGGILVALEGWRYGESCFFSFVVLAAIGYGDYLPTRDWHVYILIVYIFLGLCAAVMFADLIGIQYIRKIHAVGRLVGKATAPKKETRI